MIKRLKKLFTATTCSEGGEVGVPKSSRESGIEREDSIFRYPVRQVARGLRHRKLDQLIGTKFTVESGESADAALLPVITDYLDRADNGDELLPLSSGVHRRYGFMDVYLSAKKELLAKDSGSGIELLVGLGFLTREEGTIFLCPEDFEYMSRDIRANEAYLCLLIVEEGGAGHRPRNPSKTLDAADKQVLVFPLEFRIADACVSNSAYVWRWKHFYC